MDCGGCLFMKIWTIRGEAAHKMLHNLVPYCSFTDECQLEYYI